MGNCVAYNITAISIDVRQLATKNVSCLGKFGQSATASEAPPHSGGPAAVNWEFVQRKISLINAGVKGTHHTIYLYEDLATEFHFSTYHANQETLQVYTPIYLEHTRIVWMQGSSLDVTPPSAACDNANEDMWSCGHWTLVSVITSRRSQ